MSEAKMPHEGHDKHLCYLHNLGLVHSNLEVYKGFVRDAKFICKGCGRAAQSDKNLCKPEAL